jgi:hypothetical protein
MKWHGAPGKGSPDGHSVPLEVVRRFWKDALDRLENLLHELKVKEKKHDGTKQ